MLGVKSGKHLADAARSLLKELGIRRPDVANASSWQAQACHPRLPVLSTAEAVDGGPPARQDGVADRAVPGHWIEVSVKIATFNINNVNRRLPNLLAWLDQAKPDAVCLQELKAADHQFPEASLKAVGYNAVWHGEKTWNGVAILARGAVPQTTRRSLPGDPNDQQARYIEAAVKGVLIACLTCPTATRSLGQGSTTSLPGSTA